MLAAWLLEHGFSVLQRNLNSEFAEYLLTDHCLSWLGTGTVPGAPHESLIASCARWARRERTRLIDEKGRYILGRNTPLGYVVEELAQPFVIDPGPGALASLTAERRGTHPLKTHARFLEWADCRNEIPASIRLLGISVPMGPQIVPALLLAQVLKAARPDLRIVLGGPALSLMDSQNLDELLKNHRTVNAVVRFDGEFPLLGLARQLRAREWNPTAVPGVSALSQDMVCHIPPAAGPDLNKLPPPEYPSQDIAALAAPKLSITQARGCYWGKCDYCDFIELYDGSPPYRGRRPHLVVAEIESLIKRYGIRQFTFITESIPPAFARRLSELIIDRGIDISWDSFAMVDRRFDRDLLSLMVRAGCTYLVVGMETMTTRVLNLVHKSADFDENQRLLRDARDAGMKLSVNLIPDLPTTTYLEALESLAAIMELADCLDSVSIFSFEPTRSSNVGRTPDRFGLVAVADAAGDSQAQYSLNHMARVDPAMTPQQRADVHERFRAFARIVNLGNKVGSGGVDTQLSAKTIDITSRVRLALEDLDVIDSGHTVACMHIVGKERIDIPAAAATLLRPYFNGGQFSGESLSEHVGPAVAQALLTSLVEARMVKLAVG